MEVEMAEPFSQSAPETSAVDEPEARSFQVEESQLVEVTYPLKFDNVTFRDNPSITLNITNNSDQEIVLNKWIILCKKRDSQVKIKPFLTQPQVILPGYTFNMVMTCQPKFFGRRKEHLIFIFRGFKVERMIDINVLANTAYSYITAMENAMLEQLRQFEAKIFAHGIRPRRGNLIAGEIGEGWVRVHVIDQ